MEKLTKIISRCLMCEPQAVTLDKHLVFDLMADSVALLDLTLEVEKEYGYVFTEDDISRLDTVGDLYDVIREMPTKADAL